MASTDLLVTALGKRVAGFVAKGTPLNAVLSTELPDTAKGDMLLTSTGLVVVPTKAGATAVESGAPGPANGWSQAAGSPAKTYAASP